MTAYYSPDQIRKWMDATMAHKIQKNNSPPDVAVAKKVESDTDKCAKELQAVTNQQKRSFIPIATNQRELNNTPVGGNTNNDPKLHDYELKIVYIIDKLEAFKLANSEKCVNIGKSTFLNVEKINQ
jgi:hypothetical protein